MIKYWQRNQEKHTRIKKRFDDTCGVILKEKYQALHIQNNIMLPYEYNQRHTPFVNRIETTTTKRDKNTRINSLAMRYVY